MTRYAITGASGPFGAQALRATLELGVAPGDVVAVVRDPAQAQAATQAGVDVRRGDYTDPGSLLSALVGVDRLLLVSGPDVGRRVVQHRNVVAAAVRAGVGHLAYTSVLNADTTKLFVGDDHRATERDILASGLAPTFLRNSFYTENYLARVAGYLERGEVVSAAGDGRISAGVRADFAAAAAAALVGDGHDGQAYELGGQAFTMDELAQAVAAATGAPVRHRNIPLHLLRTGLLRSGVAPDLVAVLGQIEQCVAQGHLYTDSGDLARLLGRQPVSLAEALAGPHEDHGAVTASR